MVLSFFLCLPSRHVYKARQNPTIIVERRCGEDDPVYFVLAKVARLSRADKRKSRGGRKERENERKMQTRKDVFAAVIVAVGRRLAGKRNLGRRKKKRKRER